MLSPACPLCLFGFAGRDVLPSLPAMDLEVLLGECLLAAR